MRHAPQSPYLRALGEGASLLHPGLSSYFSAVPAGRVGIGEGVFDRVGSRRRWMRPMLRVLQRRGAVLSGWYEGVPFTVRNRTVNGTSVAERTFHLPLGDWTMRDALAVRPGGGVVDRIGEPPQIAAAFAVSVEGGALHLRSSAIGIRLGRLRVRLPAPFAPAIRLRESIAGEGRQRVELTVDAPLLGRVYEYEGTFVYRIEEEGS